MKLVSLFGIKFMLYKLWILNIMLSYQSTQMFLKCKVEYYLYNLNVDYDLLFMSLWDLLKMFYWMFIICRLNLITPFFCTDSQMAVLSIDVLLCVCSALFLNISQTTYTHVCSIFKVIWLIIIIKAVIIIKILCFCML